LTVIINAVNFSVSNYWHQSSMQRGISTDCEISQQDNNERSYVTNLTTSTDLVSSGREATQLAAAATNQNAVCRTAHVSLTFRSLRQPITAAGSRFNDPICSAIRDIFGHVTSVVTRFTSS